MTQLKRRLVTHSSVRPPAVFLSDAKFMRNVAVTLRSCSILGIRQLWVSGGRAFQDWQLAGRMPREFRMEEYMNVEVCVGDALSNMAGSVTPVAVERREAATQLAFFTHPDDALYVFGPEDGSLTQQQLAKCHQFLVLPGRASLNLGVAVGGVLLDRIAKEQRTEAVLNG